MKIQIDNIAVNYEIYGEGAPLLLLHGWGGCINSMLPIITEYSKRYKVIVLDFPGHGLSDIPPSWNITDYMNLTYNFIQKLGLNNIYIIAHSFGGRVSILLSSTYPALVKKLVLVDSGGLLSKKSPIYYFKLYGYKVGKKLIKLKYKSKEEYENWLDSQRKKRGSADYNALIPEMRATFVKVVNQNLKPYLKKIQCPTLLIWGEFDDATPVYMGKIMNKRIPNSKLVIFENCGHFSYLDNFPDFKKEVDVFFN